MTNITKSIIWGGAGLIIVAVIFFAITGTPTKASNQVTGNVATAPTGEYQEVLLTFKNYEYQLEPSTLKKDVPVRMTVDLDSIYGCMRDVVIRDFGVRKYVQPGDNIISFTPTKTGTINIACSMNMGRGQFTVVE